ncbi:MAG: amidohydrolase [Gemmatimonadaceae bacterium]|nr:amidohydrolase [Gemmatimonadaceae bacterium]
MLRPTSLAVACALLVSAAATLPSQQRPASPAPAELIVTNGRIYTVDPARPLVEALAVRGGRIVFAGSEREAASFRGAATRAVDLGGRTVIPGMVDAHAHLVGLGEALANVDLVDTRSYDDVITRVVARARQVPAGTWIQGRGWDQNDWGNTAFPTHDALTRAIPDHPVVLTRIDGHAILANAAAMRAAGVTAASQDPAGGRIERDPSGNPTGVFVDNAEALVFSAVPPTTPAQRSAAISAAITEMHRWGLTGIHDAGASRATIDAYEALARGGRLDLRLYVMISDDSAAIGHYFTRGPQSALHDGRLWIRAVKLYADGALGSRGAALLDPYTDDPNNSGLIVSPPEHIRSVAERGLRAGFQINTHAIGDRGNRVVLDAYEAALGRVPSADHRFRVEHAQVLHHDDIPRFAELGVIPSMQAVHQTSDMYWAGNRIGIGRLFGAYAWRSLLSTGVPVPNGSDFPVEHVNPLLSFSASISRMDRNGWPAGGWYPAQRMTRDEALKSMTIWPAYAAFQERDLGSLTAGKYADFVVLDRDIMTVDERDVPGATVLATYIGGKAVYERP